MKIFTIGFILSVSILTNNAYAAPGVNHIYQHNAALYDSNTICNNYRSSMIKEIKLHHGSVMTIASCDYYASYKKWTYWGVRYHNNSPITKGDKLLKR